MKRQLSVSTQSLFLALALSGCAHLRSNSSDDATPRDSASAPFSSKETNPRTIRDVLSQDIKLNNPSSNMAVAVGTPNPQPNALAQNGDIVVRGVKLKNTKFDFPVVVNSRVEYWVDYFTGRGRPYFEKYLERSEFFVPYITPILKQNGMPEDLVYLAMIESGFNNFARSHAKAVGPWQFISATGRRYGLMVNWWVDERRDTRKATLAAVEYLKDLYSMFQSWELAAAAYNAGEAKIARAMQRFGSNDFWVIAQHRFLRPETRDYVPKIIAAALLAKNREQFGFPAVAQRPGSDEAVAGDGSVVKVIKSDNPEAALAAESAKEDDEDGDGIADSDEMSDEEDANAPGITPATLTLPVDTTPPDPQLANASVEPQPLAKVVPTPHVSKNGEVGGEQLAEFEVQSPADLLKVARAAGLSYQTVKSLNPELIRWCTPPSVGSYRVKLPASTKDHFLTTYNSTSFPRQVQFLTYRTRRGETLTRIASQYGIKVDPISDLNGVSSRMPLKSGLRVLLPIPNDKSRSLASLEIRDPPEHRRGRRSGRRHRRYRRVTYKNRESAKRSNAMRNLGDSPLDRNS